MSEDTIIPDKYHTIMLTGSNYQIKYDYFQCDVTITHDGWIKINKREEDLINDCKDN